MNPINVSKKGRSKSFLISSATQCMWVGLPSEFYLAWIEVIRFDSETKALFRYQPFKHSEILTFIPASESYPVECVMELNDFLPDNKKQWKHCAIFFNPNTVKLDYKYES